MKKQSKNSKLSFSFFFFLKNPINNSEHDRFNMTGITVTVTKINIVVEGRKTR